MVISHTAQYAIFSLLSLIILGTAGTVVWAIREEFNAYRREYGNGE